MYFSSNSASSFIFLKSSSMVDDDDDQQQGNLHYYFSVDCTLSLGTPSTRRSSTPSPSVPFCCSWDSSCNDINKIQQQQQQQPTINYIGNTSSNCSTLILGGSDPLLLARRCANCDTTSTPLWRNGPRGPKSLCNACGIRYKKEERRAAASTTSLATSLNESNIGYKLQSPWSYNYPSTGLMKSGTKLLWCQNEEVMEMPNYLSWPPNVVPSHR